MATVASNTLETAFESHQAGDLGRAEAICRDLLRVDPRHADALHLLGVVAFQRDEKVAAADFIGQAIDADRRRPEYHNSLGNVYRTLGRPADAIEEFREALRLKPNFSIAYNNLGIALADCGQNRGAVACFEQALQLDPRNLQAWMNLGSAFADLGKTPNAAICFERAIEIEPNQGEAFARLGRCRAQLGRADESIAAYERAIALLGDSAPVPLLKDVASAYLEGGRSPQAEIIYRQAIARSPHDPNLLLNLAQSLKDQEKHEEAIEWYQRGVALDPQNPAAQYAMGRALHVCDRFAEAIGCYQKCLALGSCDAKAAYHLGNACKSLKRLNEAVEAYLKALEWDPSLVAAMYQLGNAYRQLNDLDGARLCLEKVLERRPGDLTTLVCLGNVLRSQDDLVGAAATFKKVISRVSDKPLWELWLATLCPIVFHSAVGIDQFRATLLAKVNTIAEMSISISPEEISDRGCPPPYYLQFHGRDNRALKEAYARIFRKCRCDTPRLKLASRSAGKPRVGFVVTDGHEGVFLRYLAGVLTRLDCDAFDPVIICSAGGELRIRTEIPPESVETFVIPSGFDKIVERIREGRFAVLYHWEIGSDVTNYFLPFFQLAPIQCTGAGLPDTSGIAQVDYFLSSDACEPERAEQNYTEQLLRSASLLTWQRRMGLPANAASRAELGVGDYEHLYLCPHKIEKFHPDFDGLLGAILRRDPDGVLVVPKDSQGHAARKLHNRLRVALPHVIERVRLAPYQSVESYFRLVQAADVLLDPIHYGGGLTSLDGLSLNKPIVTMPGPFVRGRYTFGFYRTMGLTDCVAANADDYVERAVRLGRDREWRAHVESRIRDTSDVLFESSDSIAEYDRIFRQLVDEALTKGT
ncbi:MAG TPA: tetratricopeptide repeat protein [Planctomycetaceae bacterium]|nr:tetratricopeptide repeat protein [Planctomycetaceae bacterium]